MTIPARGAPGLAAFRRAVGKGFRRGELTPSTKRKGRAEPFKWFSVPIDGRLVMHCPKAEMGQGVATALAQIAAEELGLGVDQIEVRHLALTTANGKKANARGFGSATATAASSSVSSTFHSIRMSAAALREMMLNEAGVQLGIPAEELTLLDGAVQLRSGADPIRKPIAAIVAEAKLPLDRWPVPNAPRCKVVADFTVIGTDFPRVDVVTKLTGEATYGFDATLPGTVYGCVAHPPRYGARLRTANTTAALRLAGVIDVVVDLESNFVGAVATTRMKANAALAACALEWDGGTRASSGDLVRELRRPGGPVLIDRGQADRVLSGGDPILDVEYTTQTGAHAHLEPICALANVTETAIEVWVPTQQPVAVAADVGKALKRSNVTVHQTLLGSGFGRKFMVHAATDAARLSAAVGRPVHVAWTPKHDLQAGPFRPPTLTRMRGSVANGRILAIDQYSATGSVGDFGRAAMALLKFHPGAQTGIELPYEFPNYRVAARLARLPVPTGIWRSVGLMPNTFAVESFIDELAAEAGVDPLDFRLRQLPNSPVGRNLRRLLEAVAARSGWLDPLPSNTGRGVAVAGMAGTLVAVVTRVSVMNGTIRVQHVDVCADPGLVINPAGARLQIAGGVMMGVSCALAEEVTFADGMAVQASLKDYRLLRSAEAPTVDVCLMGSGEHPAGLGEPAIGPIPAAIANAVFVASGQRLRSLPLQLVQQRKVSP
jgi:isoquinoline 1-oxidoreductase subunit beta